MNAFLWVVPLSPAQRHTDCLFLRGSTPPPSSPFPPYPLLPPRFLCAFLLGFGKGHISWHPIPLSLSPAASGYGTQNIRLSRDAVKDFDCCCLSLQPCHDPVVT